MEITTRRTGWRSLAAMAALLGLLVAGDVGLSSAQGSPGPDQVTTGAKQIGQGVEKAAKGIGTTVTEGAKDVGRKLKPTADTLHDRAKGFGEALWGGMKSIGRTLAGVFTGEKK